MEEEIRIFEIPEMKRDYERWQNFTIDISKMTIGVNSIVGSVFANGDKNRLVDRFCKYTITIIDTAKVDLNRMMLILKDIIWIQEILPNCRVVLKTTSPFIDPIFNGMNMRGDILYQKDLTEIEIEIARFFVNVVNNVSAADNLLSNHRTVRYYLNILLNEFVNGHYIFSGRGYLDPNIPPKSYKPAWYVMNFDMPRPDLKLEKIDLVNVGLAMSTAYEQKHHDHIDWNVDFSEKGLKTTIAIPAK